MKDLTITWKPNQDSKDSRNWILSQSFGMEPVMSLDIIGFEAEMENPVTGRLADRRNQRIAEEEYVRSLR